MKKFGYVIAALGRHRGCGAVDRKCRDHRGQAWRHAPRLASRSREAACIAIAAGITGWIVTMIATAS